MDEQFRLLDAEEAAGQVDADQQDDPVLVPAYVRHQLAKERWVDQGAGRVDGKLGSDHRAALRASRCRP